MSRSFRFTRPTTLLACLGLVAASACAPEGPEGPFDPDVAVQEIEASSLEVAESLAGALEGNAGADDLAADLRGTWQQLRDPAAVPAVTPSAAAAAERPWGVLPGVRRLRDMSAALVGENAGAVNKQSAAGELSEQLAAAAREMKDVIRERLLSRRNLESRTEREAVYRLRPDPTCRDRETDAIDKDCREFFSKVEVRLRVTRANVGEGHELAVLIGHERLHPLSLFVARREVASEVYLREAKRAAAHLARTFDEPDESPDVLSGTVRTSLVRQTADRVSLSLAILEKIEVHAAEGAVIFRTDVARPALSLVADGASGRITSTVGFGLSEVLVASEEGVGKSWMRLVLPGAQATAIFSEAEGSLALDDVGVGPGTAFAELHGQRVVAVDVNANDGRKFSARIAPGANGQPRITVTPRADLAVMFKLAPVAAEFNESFPAELLDESYRLLADQSGGVPFAIEPFTTTGATPTSGLAIVSGSLSLSSNRGGTPFTARAGECVGEQAPAAGQHVVLGSLKIVPCR